MERITPREAAFHWAFWCSYIWIPCQSSLHSQGKSLTGILCLYHILEIHKHTAWGFKNDSASFQGKSPKITIRPSSLLTRRKLFWSDREKEKGKCEDHKEIIFLDNIVKNHRIWEMYFPSSAQGKWTVAFSRAMGADWSSVLCYRTASQQTFLTSFFFEWHFFGSYTGEPWCTYQALCRWVRTP